MKIKWNVLNGDDSNYEKVKILSINRWYHLKRDKYKNLMVGYIIK